MKKIVALVLSLTMVFTLCACGSVENKRGEVTSVDKSVVDEVKGEVNSQVEEEEKSVADAVGELFEAGSNKNGVYENKFLGIACDFDENWTLLSDEQIKENNKLTLAMVGDDYGQLMEEVMSNGSTIQDMMATNINSTDSINVTISNTKLSGALVDLNTYAAATVKMVEDPLSQMGIQNITTDIKDYEFAGKESVAITIQGVLVVPVDETNNVEVNMYETLVLFKKGTYMASVAACSFFEDYTDEYLSMFYEVK